MAKTFAEKQLEKARWGLPEIVKEAEFWNNAVKVHKKYIKNYENIIADEKRN
jgi:hypothetical protein